MTWELSSKLDSNSQDLQSMLQHLRNLQQSLESSRLAFNGLLKERDAIREQAIAADRQLKDMQHVLERYNDVSEPVIASDGYTYEREILRKYLEECKENGTMAYSNQTQGELTDTYVNNASLRRLVDQLRDFKGSDIREPQYSYDPIPLFDDCVSPEGELADPAPANNAGSNKTGTTTFAAAVKNATAKASNEEGQKVSGRLHPCLRVYGRCSFTDCQFAQYPYEACLNNIKGRCRFGASCKELHVNDDNADGERAAPAENEPSGNKKANTRTGKKPKGKKEERDE